MVVSGEPGVGKTRLLDEIESLARARGIRVLHGRSVERDRSFPYQGFCDAIQEYFRYKDSGSSAAADFSDLAPDLLALFPMLTEIVEIREAASGGAQTARSGASGAENQTQVFELLARTLTRIAGGKPLVLAMEDLHAAEVSLEALQYIVRRLGPTPTLVLGSYRTSEVDRRHPLTRVLEGFRGDRRFATIPLGPLPPAEHRAFVETLVGGAGLTESLAQRLYEGTEGNPFFTKELVRSLLGSGAIAADATGQWTLSGEAALSADAMPATIQEAVEGRIQRLPEDLRQLLATASVLGRSFDVRDLEALAEGRGRGRPRPPAASRATSRSNARPAATSWRSRAGWSATCSTGRSRRASAARCTAAARRGWRRGTPAVSSACCPSSCTTTSTATCRRRRWSTASGSRAPRSTPSARRRRSARRGWPSPSSTTSGRATGASRPRRACSWRGRTAWAATSRAPCGRRRPRSPSTSGRAAPPPPRRPLLFAAETAWQARRSDEAGRFAEKGLVAARQAGEPAVLRPLLSLAATLANLRGDYDRAKALMEEGEALGARPRGARGRSVPAGGRLVVALANPVKSIEPGTIQTNEEAEVAANVYETLLATSPDGNLIPGLCEKWEPLEEGTCLPPHPAARRPLLRRAAADRGRRQGLVRGLGPPDPGGAAVGAERRARGGRAPRRRRPRGSRASWCGGDHELEIQLLEPLPDLPGAAHRGEHRGHAGPAPGGGRAGDGAVPRRLARGGPGRPRAEPPVLAGAPGRCSTTLEFRSFPSANAIAASYRAGEVDLARDLLPEDLEEILRDPRLRRGLVEAPKKNTYFVLFNCRSGPAAARAELRRALAGTVRARDLVWRTLGRFAEPATSLIPPAMVGHDPGRRSAALTREEALALLEAGRRRGAGAAAGLGAPALPRSLRGAARRASGALGGARGRGRGRDAATWPPTSTPGRRATASTS